MQEQLHDPFFGMAQRIAALRRARGLTQRQLAAQLHVTDKAVSKWERGAGRPDITILPALAAALGVTAGELLTGVGQAPSVPERAPAPLCAKRAGAACRADGAPPRLSGENAPRPAREPARQSGERWLRRCGLCLAAALALGASVCLLCDGLVNGRVTWSFASNSAMLYAALVLCPPLCRPGRRIRTLLLCVTGFTVPLLWALERFSRGDWLWRLGAPCAAMGCAYLWLLWGARGLVRRGAWRFASVACALAAPLSAGVNLLCGAWTGRPETAQAALRAAFWLAGAALCALCGARRKQAPDSPV